MDAQPIRIGGLTPLSSIDYPGHLSAVVYCQGCPWRCGYCHNAHLIPRTRQPHSPDWSKVLALLHRRRGLLDAVVFSGGEPTLQVGLADAIRTVKAMGFKVGLHTAGPYPSRLKAILPELDWVALDIKALPEDYETVTGVPGSSAAAWKCAALIVAAGIPHEVRTTVHPDLLSADQIVALGQQLARAGIQCYRVQQLRAEHCLDPARRTPTRRIQLAELLAPLRASIADSALR